MSYRRPARAPSPPVWISESDLVDFDDFAPVTHVANPDEVISSRRYKKSAGVYVCWRPNKARPLCAAKEAYAPFKSLLHATHLSNLESISVHGLSRREIKGDCTLQKQCPGRAPISVVWLAGTCELSDKYGPACFQFPVDELLSDVGGKKFYLIEVIDYTKAQAATRILVTTKQLELPIYDPRAWGGGWFRDARGLNHSLLESRRCNVSREGDEIRSHTLEFLFDMDIPLPSLKLGGTLMYIEHNTFPSRCPGNPCPEESVSPDAFLRELIRLSDKNRPHLLHLFLALEENWEPVERLSKQVLRELENRFTRAGDSLPPRYLRNIKELTREAAAPNVGKWVEEAVNRLEYISRKPFTIRREVADFANTENFSDGMRNARSLIKSFEEKPPGVFEMRVVFAAIWYPETGDQLLSAYDQAPLGNLIASLKAHVRGKSELEEEYAHLCGYISTYESPFQKKRKR